LGKVITYLLEFLKNNYNLVHLDLSYNPFSYEDSVLISEALKNNKTLLGFHFIGIFGHVDNRGFLKFDK